MPAGRQRHLLREHLDAVAHDVDAALRAAARESGDAGAGSGGVPLSARRGAGGRGARAFESRARAPRRRSGAAALCAAAAATTTTTTPRALSLALARARLVPTWSEAFGWAPRLARAAEHLAREREHARRLARAGRAREDEVRAVALRGDGAQAADDLGVADDLVQALRPVLLDPRHLGRRRRRAGRGGRRALRGRRRRRASAISRSAIVASPRAVFKKDTPRARAGTGTSPRQRRLHLVQ